MKWQPIETAPKDGTWILACKGSFQPAIARWTQYHHGGSFEYIDPEDYADESHFDDIVSCSEKWTPTHWMPLPAPPTI